MSAHNRTLGITLFVVALMVLSAASVAGQDDAGQDEGGTVELFIPLVATGDAELSQPVGELPDEWPEGSPDGSPGEKPQTPDQPIKSSESQLSAAAAIAIAADSNDQTRPAVAYNSRNNEYLVIWQHQYSATDLDLYAQRLDAAGAPTGARVAVATTTASEYRPAVAYNAGANEYFIVWEQTASESNHDIYAQRVAANGVLQGAVIAVSTYANDERAPDVAYDTYDNQYLVVWGLDGIDGYSLYGQRYSTSGVPVGTTIDIAYSDLTVATPSVAYNAYCSTYLVAWQQTDWSTAGADIQAQLVRTDGTLQGDRIVITAAANEQRNPRIAAVDDRSEWIVVWEHQFSGSDYDLYGVMVRNYWPYLSGSTFTIANTILAETNPDVSAKAGYRYPIMVTWEYAYTTLDHDVYQRQANTYGEFSGDARSVSALGSPEGAPAITAGGGDAYLLAWEDGRDAATQGLNIYGGLTPAYVPAPFSGHVYSGALGVTSAPLAGVTVELHCSNDQTVGAVLTSTLTAADGGFALPRCWGSDYSNLVQVDLPGYVSVGAQSAYGEVVNPHWVRYTNPVADTQVAGNDFWDKPIPPDDRDAPGGWDDFAPSAWVNQQLVTAHVQVADQVSGLAVSSAAYAFTIDGGSTWSAWLPATCTGVAGSTWPETVTAGSVPFNRDSIPLGSNGIKFRIADQAGNVGESPVYGVKIDTQPPQNPALTCSPTIGAWTNNNIVTCSWPSAADSVSGVAGYSVAINQIADYIPYPTLAMPGNSYTSGALPEGANWYFHLRAVDNAGNGAAAVVRHGPFHIDRTAPTSSVAALPPWQGAEAFTVTWSGSAGGGSPIAGYDLRVTDAYQGSSSTSDWLLNTGQTSATFHGSRGHVYSFMVRARDQAGNLEAYPGAADASTTVGRDTQVVVRDENGAGRAGARIYLNQGQVGVTGAGGVLTVRSLLVGDTLAAMSQVHEQPAVKPGHTSGGSGNWSWRVYQTTMPLNNQGVPQLYRVTTLTGSETLTVRKNQALIGFHVQVSVEWDANSDYLTQLESGLGLASAYLYDATDGQLFWEIIEVFDDRDQWGASDMRVHASNRVWPNASVWGIVDGTDQHIYMGRYFNGGTANQGNWDQSNGFRTMIHEFGHYGLGLWDEYLDRSGKKVASAFCADVYTATVEAERSSIMFHQFDSTELCSNVNTNHHHNTNTQHDAIRGETTWATVVSRYRDTASPPRWTLLTPEDRGAILAGPNGFPLQMLTHVTVSDAQTGACAPFGIHGSCTGCTSLITETVVWIDRTCAGCQDIEEGTLDAAGNLTILGAHDGDMLRAKTPDNASGSMAVECSAVSAAGDQPIPVPVQPDPFQLSAQLVPVTEDRVQVVIAASTALANSPSAELWQSGADAATAVALTYDAAARHYAGTAPLGPGLGLDGYLYVAATDQQQHTVVLHQPFHLTPIAAQAVNPMIQSADGDLMMTLPPGALSQNAMLAIERTSSGVALPAGLGELTLPYRVVVSTGETQLAKPAAINMRYHGEQAAGTDLSTLAIYRWDAASGRWLPLSSEIDTSMNIVSASTQDLTTFMVLGRRSTAPGIYLPLIRR